jgi:hypothetical protein
MGTGKRCQIIGDRFGKGRERGLFVSRAPGGEVIPVGAVSTQGVDGLRSEQKARACGSHAARGFRRSTVRALSGGEAASLPCSPVSGAESMRKTSVAQSTPDNALLSFLLIAAGFFVLAQL